jgi:hypothetical protein
MVKTFCPTTDAPIFPASTFEFLVSKYVFDTSPDQPNWGMVASKKSPTHVNNNVLPLLTFTDRQLSNPFQTNEEKNAN